MKAFTVLFSEHPQSVGETYGQHLMAAGRFGVMLLSAAVVCLVHAVFPFLFEKTGSRMITQLYQRMVCARQRESQLDCVK